MSKSTTPPRRPTAYGYVRVSTDDQAESGLGLADQTHLATARMQALAQQHDLTIGRIYSDPGISASRVPLLERPGGRELDRRLLAGDHVVIAKLDRAFRSSLDCATTVEMWRDRGIAMHILDLSVDTSTHIGDLIINVMAAIAQWESRRIGERIRGAKRAATRQGRASGAVAPMGWAIGPDRMLTPHEDERAIAERIDTMRAGGMTYPAIAAALNREEVPRPARALATQQTLWTHQAVGRLHAAAVAGWPIGDTGE